MRQVRALALTALFVLGSSALHAATTFTVDSTLDTPDDLIDGVCADANGKCTLRAAIMEANIGPNVPPVTIFLPAGTYTITRPVSVPDGRRFRRPAGGCPTRTGACWRRISAE